MLEWPRPEAPGYQERDGSLVFVDISGFTKMSERLAKKGKVGAEEVTEILNSTFTRLLAVAYENGGTLLKFGGDALLVFFYGHEHAPRAVHAAAGMRRKLAEIGKGLKSSAGNVTLRMSVGVHTGLFHFFLAGSLHRELIVAGPAASRTVEMEGTAEAGEILLSPELASVTDPSLLGARKGEGTLLARTPPPPRLRGDDAVAMPGFDLEPFIPVAIRERVASGVFDPEHRQVTVAFVHFDGTDRLVASAGCSDVAAKVHELVAVSQAAAAEHDVTFLGTDVDHDGGKIILVAGTPKATGHDEEQMLRTLRTIMDARPAIPVRIGVNRGHVFSGEVGPPYRRTYTVMGDAVNLAARVMAKAAPRQILATPEVLDRSRTLFETTALEPFLVKGKAHPVTAYVVGAIRGARAEHDADLPLVGRDAELATLEGALERAEAGSGSLVEITAGAGLGKSRLLLELRRRATHIRSLTVAAEQYEAQTPYYAVNVLLRGLLDIPRTARPEEAGTRLVEVADRVAPELAPWIPLVAVPLDATVPPTKESAGLDETFKLQRLHSSVALLLERLLDGPAVIGIEDAHWLDQASNDLLRYVVRDLPSKRWLIVVTSRPEGRTLLLPPDRESLVIHLEPLAGADSVALARAAAGRVALPAHVLEAIAGRSGGHPLFLQELVTASRAGESIEGLPDSVEAIINARIDTLDPAERSLLRYASVVGAQFSLDVLRESLTGDSASVMEQVSWQHLDEFIEPEGQDRYRFRHMLFRDVAYEALPYKRRRDLHDRIGNAIESRSGDRAEESAEVLSLHFDRAGHNEKAWRYSVLAGDRAKEKFANVQAGEFYMRALNAARRIGGLPAPRLAAVQEALGDVSTQAALYEQAATAYASARRLLRGEPGEQPRLHRKEGVLRRLSGNYRQALSWFARGLKAAGEVPGATAEAIELTIAYAGVLFHQGRYQECIRRCLSVESDAERLGLKAALGHIYYLVHTAYTWIGDPRRADYRHRALPIYQELGDLLGQANTLINLGVDAYFAGEWDEALRVNREAREVLEKIGDVIGVADALNNIAEILSDQGKIDEATATFSEAEAAYRAAKTPYGIALSEINLGRAAARAGSDEDATRLLQRALAGFEDIKAESWIAEAKARIAEAHVLAGRSAEALPLLEETLAQTERIGGLRALQAMLHRNAGYAAMQRGDFASAASSLGESLRIAKKADALFEVALTLEARALLGRIAGNPDPGAERESRALLDRLGVLSTPRVPVPAAT